MASPVKDAKARVVARFPSAQVSERGRSSLNMEVSPGRFVYQSQVGQAGWHFGTGPFSETNEVDSDWVPGDGAPYRLKMTLADYNAYAGLDDPISFDAGPIVHYVDPGSGESLDFIPQALGWTNDNNDISQIGAVQGVAGQVTGDLIAWFDAFGPGLDFQWQTQTTRLEKVLIAQTLASLGTVPQYIIDGGNPKLQLQFIWQRSAGVRAWVDGVLFDEKNRTQLSTFGDIEFRSVATGEVLWYFKAPAAWDSGVNLDLKPSQINPEMRLRAGPSSLYVSILIPLDWIQSAIFPIFIDPTTNPAVGQSSDDAYEQATSVSTTFAQPAIDQAGEWLGNRWPLPAGIDGATVNDCNISWYFFTSGGDEPAVLVYFEDSGASPGTFTTGTSDISNRPRTTASFDFQNTDLGAPGWFSTGTNSLDTLLEELIATYDYSSGGYLVATVTQNGAANRDFVTYSYDQDTAYAPLLYIDYSTGGASVALSTATVTLSGQALTLTPGAVAILLDTASALLSGQAATLSPGPVAPQMQTASVQIAGQTLTLTPGAVAIGLATGVILVNGRAITVSSGGSPVSIPLSTATLTINGQPIAVSPGPASILTATAQITISADAITIVPGPVAPLLSTATTTIGAQNLTVLPGPVAPTLQTGVITASGRNLTVLPGPVAPLLSTATATISAQNTTILPGQVAVDLSTAQIQVGAQTITPTPGSVSINLATGQLLINGRAIGIVSGDITYVNLTTAQITLSGQGLTILPGGVSISLLTADVSLAAEALGISTGEVAVALQTGQLSVVAPAAAIVPGPVAIALASAIMQIVADPAAIDSSVAISLQTAQIVLQSTGLVLEPGAIAIPLSTAALSILAGVVDPVAGTPPGFETPIDRIILVVQENRTIVVLDDGRLDEILFEDRTEEVESND